jgi:CheY-like chemotaxis protein
MYERFILIDDNEADNVFHEIMIRRAGFEGEIRVFESGVDALAYFEQDDAQTPTCIFLDINMPLMDGFEVANRLTPTLASRPWVLLVMLTSSGNPADRTRSETIPAIKGFVTKPLDVSTVKNVMTGDD